jgi:hypothetical protein
MLLRTNTQPVVLLLREEKLSLATPYLYPQRAGDADTRFVRLA